LSAYRLRRLQIRFVLRRASSVVVLSRALEALAHESGAAPEKIVRIPNGVDGAAFRPNQREEARRPLGLPADARIVVSAGGLCRRKGHHRLVEIWPKVRREVPGAMLLIVGGPTAEGDETEALLRMIGERGLGSDVRLAGPRPHEEMPLWLSAADLFVLATTNEGSCNVVREALSCGTPVVTTPVGDNAEAVHGPACGVLVRPDETAALARAVIEGLTRVWDREGVRSSVASESWDGVAARVADVWRSVANVDEEEVRVLERSQARS
ncbi:MAG: glycosyltransferase, partial [Nitrospirae bacterium]|nr:glycosyltransferase [Nitrospirota bacterium]